MIFDKYFFSCFSDRNSQKEERLNDAAKGGDLATVRELIKTTFVDTTEGSPTLQGLSRGWTPLIQAGKIFFFSSLHPDIKDKLSHILLHIG